MRNLTKALTVVSLLAPVSGHSLGIGDIRVRSALNQNLNAEINLVASRGENPNNIKVNLAPPEKFDEAGVPWSYFLSKIRFQPIIKPNGSMVIKVTSREALKEPYLNFLLEVSWPKGNLYREFTVLVDPPSDYQQPAAAYQEPVYQEPAYPTTSTYDNYSPDRQDYVPRNRPARHSNRPARNSAGNYGGQITARRNDTLWNVAERVRGSGVSVEQMMIALYQQNQHAFYQQNVNALSAGKTLKVPEKEVVQQISRQEALAEFGQHNAAWNNNRSSVPAGQTQLVKENTPDSQLKLEAPNEAAVAANESVSPSSEQAPGSSTNAPARPALDTQKQATKGSTPVDEAVQAKIDALEKQMATMQQLIALKDKQLAELQNPGQGTAPATSPEPATQLPPTVTPPTPAPTQAEPAVTPPVTTAPPAQVTPPTPPPPVQPAVPPKPAVKPVENKTVQPTPPVAEESGFSLPLILGSLGALVLSIFGWLWWQKKKATQETEAESMFRSYSSMRSNSDLSGPFSASRKVGAESSTLPGDSSFLNDFKASDFESFESFNVDHGDIDPIAEADVYLAYGRFQQAEELIRQAIKDFPDRDDCKLKLLEIFQASSNKEGFDTYAGELVAEGKQRDTEFWSKATELSLEISPESALFLSSPVSNTAVFSAEPEVLTESILLSPTLDNIANKEPIDVSEHQSAATFDISDIAEEESLFDTKPSELPVTQRDEPVMEAAKSESIIDERQDLDLSLFEDDLSELKDNEALDFDLGPYPGSTKSQPEHTPDAGNIENAFGTLDDLGDKNELETYEFDFKSDTTEDKPLKIESIQEEDSWDLNQTLDFSIDKLPMSDSHANSPLDFSFDLDLQASPAAKSGDSGQGFMVSDLTDMDEVETKLDLAKAYIDMGDADAAKDIIKQVIEKGSPEQKKTAQMLLDELS